MYDIIIIGAGAAGMTSALYARRNGKTVLVLEGESLGGQIATSPRLENYPSVKSVSGEEFADRLFEQITDLGADVEIERATRIEKRGEGDFFVHTDGREAQGAENEARPRRPCRQGRVLLRRVRRPFL